MPNFTQSALSTNDPIVNSLIRSNIFVDESWYTIFNRFTDKYQTLINYTSSVFPFSDPDTQLLYAKYASSYKLTCFPSPMVMFQPFRHTKRENLNSVIIIERPLLDNTLNYSGIPLSLLDAEYNLTNQHNRGKDSLVFEKMLQDSYGLYSQRYVINPLKLLDQGHLIIHACPFSLHFGYSNVNLDISYEKPNIENLLDDWSVFISELVLTIGIYFSQDHRNTIPLPVLYMGNQHVNAIDKLSRTNALDLIHIPVCLANAYDDSDAISLLLESNPLTTLMDRLLTYNLQTPQW